MSSVAPDALSVTELLAAIASDPNRNRVPPVMGVDPL